ncbi:hypothetical protein FRB98_006285 [Tulasnella sp. 332]|nr:hypothetical protein FRB98_006285 [Tulasnella sp. 332]
MADDVDSLISVWYHSDILIGYLGESDEGVLTPVAIEKALRIKTPELDGFKQNIFAKLNFRLICHRIVAHGSVPATSLATYCELAECTDNSTYSSQIWHVNRSSREIIPAFTNDYMETDLGIVFEQKWTGVLHLTLKDINSETPKTAAIELCND